uniref:CRAL-TRIO domain-containing protein n=1 Tax=Spumella elongata TaxID=89044 RepID=A0A7S3M0V5_9STRA|mmetsp:Transcript_19704/g.34181  ORF Transcript_19704/g.34181 Transcript_19704/m.34181 type:complete len:322 (+) Transcript_19704:94-1059(+)|eukprot:CAMPEP_0184974082 /NCGR_PEP_ID=MMETSP1098-20130426/5638_1 /TAXON_ID=89044 /ORGANISM="Spumella elongata, Strain CCAP 955/1" /LENGTH=321 /DNA_ID=CAMNT_0027496603 /DNA_START=82 /DNA_END=1047 /DNA_ORIENTATION=+
MAELNAKEQEALEAMRTAFDGEDGFGMPMNDLTYGRYLRARNFNVVKATKMLRETLVWRKEFDFPKLYAEDKPIIANENSTGKMYVRGYDKEGSALIYMKPVHENTKDHVGNIKHLVYTMERAIACMDAKGQGCSKLSLVIDYDGYNTSHMPPFKTSTETLNILQNHYPERLKCAYTLRAPFVFYAFFRMVSPFIDPVTKKKICMIKNAEVGKDACQLNQEVDREVLETCVGGLDERPFVSADYIAAPFHLDYLSILNGVSTAEPAAEVAVVAASLEELKVVDSDVSTPSTPATPALTPLADEEVVEKVEQPEQESEAVVA